MLAKRTIYQAKFTSKLRQLCGISDHTGGLFKRLGTIKKRT